MIPESTCFIKALVDSGNLFGDIISGKLATALKIPYKPCTKKAGTAVSGQNVHVLGQADPFFLILEGLKKPVLINPFVIENLSHDINLGENFLRQNNAKLNFAGTKVTLEIDSEKIELVNKNIPLIRNSTDKRFIKIMNNDKRKRDKLQEKDKVTYVEIEESGFSVQTRKKVKIPANSVCQVRVKTKLNSDTGYFKNKETSAFLNNNNLLPMQGIFNINNNEFVIPILNMGDKTLTIPSRVRLGKIYPGYNKEQTDTEINTLDHRPETELTDKEIEERRAFLREQLSVKDMVIDKEGQEKVIDIFMKYFDAVSVGPEDFGKSDELQFHITLKPGTQPNRAKCRPLNPFQEEDLKLQLKEWLKADVIEPSVSPWASALVPCKKKGTGRLRWAIDYRYLNGGTVKDTYPLPNIESNLHKLSGASIFSSLDSAGAFHSLCISPESRDYTTFISPFGTYRYKRMAFGLSNSPSVYCRLVQQALDRLPPGYAIAYLDDILVYSDNINDHLTHLESVIKVHAHVGMKLNVSTCHLFRSKVNYLGHQVSKQGVEMVDSYVEKIKNWPTPETGKSLISFLGFCSYYRGFIPEYAKTVACLNKYRNEKEIKLTEEEKGKIEELKQLFLKKPIRAYPQYKSEEPFILDTDFSGIAAGGTLAQVQEGQEKMIGCFSKSLDSAQSKYPAHKGELLAVILGLRKFEHILRARKFLIRTDSSAITFIQGLKEARGIWARWLVYLSSFEFDIIHRPGKQNLAADALSRTVIISDKEDQEHEDNYLIYPEIDDVYVINPEINSQEGIKRYPELREIVKHKNKEEWKLETCKDYPLQKVIDYVKKGEPPSWEERKNLPPGTNIYLKYFPYLYVQDEMLYIRRPKDSQELEVSRVCVPRGLQQGALELAHLGHRGITETKEKLCQRAFFPNMIERVKLLVNNCTSCIQKFNSTPSTQHVQAHKELLSYPMQRVYLDTVGPLTPSKVKGRICKHILTVQDGFTRYLTGIPIPDLEANTILAALNDGFLSIHGMPETIHTDQGSSLMSSLFQNSCTQMGIKLTQTPAYSPQGNRVERSHRTLGQLLRADDSSAPGSWTDKLISAIFEINIARNRITGVSPYFAMYGRNVRIPLDVYFPEDNLRQVNTLTSYVNKLSFKMERIHSRMVEQESLSIPVSNQIKSPRSKNPITPGDIVYYFSPRGILNLSKKLTLRWTGPYRVLQKPTESMCIIYPVGNWATNPREIATLITKLRKINPEFSPTIQEQVNLNLLPEEDLEDEEVIFPEITGTNSREDTSDQPRSDTESDSEEDTMIYFPPIGCEESVTPPPEKVLEKDTTDTVIKTEQVSPQHTVELTDSRDNISPETTPPVQKITRTKKPLPPPRDIKEKQRGAFVSAQEKLAQTLKRKK